MIEDLRDLEICEYSERDFEGVAKVFRDTYVQTYPDFDETFHELKRFRTILRKHTIPQAKIAQVAKLNNEIIGFVVLTDNFVDQLYIRDTFQNRGLGVRWIAMAKSAYPSFLELYTFQCNHKAIEFYERHGFRIIENGIAPDEKMPDVKMRWET